MKRFFALALAIIVLAAVLCACGDKSTGSVTTTVAAKYDDGYAENYASSASTDDSGNKVYEFSAPQYDSYTQNHKNTLAADLQSEVAANHEPGYGEYIYMNDEKKAVMVGIHEGEYDPATAEAEAASIAEKGFVYFQNLETPVNTIRVIYCDAGDQSVEYGSFEFTAE